MFTLSLKGSRSTTTSSPSPSPDSSSLCLRRLPRQPRSHRGSGRNVGVYPEQLGARDPLLFHCHPERSDRRFRPYRKESASFRPLDTHHSPLITIPFRIRTSPKSAPNPFRMRSFKTKNLKLFRMNSSEKIPGGPPRQNPLQLVSCRKSPNWPRSIAGISSPFMQFRTLSVTPGEEVTRFTSSFLPLLPAHWRSRGVVLRDEVMQHYLFHPERGHPCARAGGISAQATNLSLRASFKG